MLTAEATVRAEGVSRWVAAAMRRRQRATGTFTRDRRSVSVVLDSFDAAVAEVQVLPRRPRRGTAQAFAGATSRPRPAKPATAVCRHARHEQAFTAGERGGKRWPKCRLGRAAHRGSKGSIAIHRFHARARRPFLARELSHELRRRRRRACHRTMHSVSSGCSGLPVPIPFEAAWPRFAYCDRQTGTDRARSQPDRLGVCRPTAAEAPLVTGPLRRRRSVRCRSWNIRTVAGRVAPGRYPALLAGGDVVHATVSTRSRRRYAVCRGDGVVIKVRTPLR